MHSKAFIYSDLESDWYKSWSKKLKQDDKGRGDFEPNANKFWQNAAIAQCLYERGALSAGKQGLGFGVGAERLPALFASMDVKVLATDQDFTQDKATYWENGQLSHGTDSLNNEGICNPNLFEKNISYQSVDMTKIPKKLNNKHDFLWSNCALGHLGSIDKSLEYIEKSLRCLKPGGYAVHTTEANILSDEDTLDHQDTVFFRQSDLLKLFKRLTNQGYLVSALDFKLFVDSDDNKFTLLPKWGSSFSKLLFDGYMATQIIIIIHRPARPTTALRRRLEILKHSIAYRKNLAAMTSYKKNNQELSKLLKYDSANKRLSPEDISVSPFKTKINLSLKIGQTKKVKLNYENNSAAGLFKIHGCLKGSNPIVVATSDPINKDSKFAGENWYSKNRPTIEFNKQISPNEYDSAEYIQPDEAFEVVFDIKGPKLKPGKYEESFVLVKESEGVLAGTEVTLEINLI